MSLPRVYEDRYVADFVRVEGLPGYLLANQFNGDQFNDPSWQPIGRQTDEDTYVQSKVGGHKGKLCGCHAVVPHLFANFLASHTSSANHIDNCQAASHAGLLTLVIRVTIRITKTTFCLVAKSFLGE